MMIVFLTAALYASAQSKVRGTVTDEQGEPIMGASVIVDGTSNGTVTDLNGNFTINNVPKNAKINISYVSFVTQHITFTGQSCSRKTTSLSTRLWSWATAYSVRAM